MNFKQVSKVHKLIIEHFYWITPPASAGAAAAAAAAEEEEEEEEELHEHRIWAVTH